MPHEQKQVKRFGLYSGLYVFQFGCICKREMGGGCGVYISEKIN
ncbi:hypothetical protein HanRHA438_Chr02g0088811 [Helianthus annuus]|nr:hypothetical protein HanRHA438_Chr02g0088811 [Helianthus annuus]